MSGTKSVCLFVLPMSKRSSVNAFCYDVARRLDSFKAAITFNSTGPNRQNTDYDSNVMCLIFNGDTTVSLVFIFFVGNIFYLSGKKGFFVQLNFIIFTRMIHYIGDENVEENNTPDPPSDMVISPCAAHLKPRML